MTHTDEGYAAAQVYDDTISWSDDILYVCVGLHMGSKLIC